jgi:hypothetical protein
VAEHPIRVTIEDDLGRWRLTVLLRLLLAIPHLLWLFLWSIAVFVVAILNWFATLFMGRSPEGLHSFLASYTRYQTHVYAYLYLAASPFPGFTGEPYSYPLDVQIDPPARQRRLVTAFRIFLALPAIFLATALVGSCGSGGGGGGGSGESDAELVALAFSLPGVVAFISFFAWCVCLARGRMPAGFRDFIAFGLRYNAQVIGYVLLLTDRYPNSDPAAPRTPEPPPPHPLGLDADGDDLRRSRLTVFFRLLLAFPHFVWLTLWSLAALVALVPNWFATLLAGRSPNVFHRFLSAFVRYDVHVIAFVFLIANPFPGFTGASGRYPIEVTIEPRERQSRWITAFRSLLVIPAWFILFGLGLVLNLVAFFGWFAALATGRMPRGFRNLGAFVLRYMAQTNGYFYLLTDRYPFTGPLQRAEEELEPEPLPAYPLAESF